MKLYELSEKYRLLIELQRYEAEGNEGEIPDNLSDELDKIEGELTDKLLHCGLAFKNFESEAAMVEVERKKLESREKTLKNKAEWIKKYIQANMPKDATVTDSRLVIKWNKSKAVELKVPVEELPEEYQKCTFEPKKKLLGDAIKRGNLDVGKYAEIVERSNIGIK